MMMKLLIAILCAVAVAAQTLTCTDPTPAAPTTPDNQMLGFGANWNGQLSPQRSTNPVQTIPSLMYVASVKAPEYTKVSIGLQHALVIEKKTKKVYAAGDGTSAQLGGGITTVKSKVETYSTWEQVLIGKQPEKLTDEIIDVAAGWYTSCAIARSSNIKTTIFCSGKNNRGQLGNSSVKTQISYPIPLEFDDTQLAAGEHFVKIAAGADHMVAITSQNNVWAWGAGTEGELGNGANTDSKVPVKIDAFPTRNGRDTVEEIQCGFRFCIALTKDTNGDGSLYGWGRNDANQLGLNTAESQETVNTPTLIISGGVTSFSVGGAHTLAMINGKLHTFGSGTMGQTGHPKTISAAMQEEWTVSTPTAIPAFANVNVNTYASGMKHSLVHDNCGNVYAMGAEALGALGLGTQGSATKEFRRMEPVQITSLLKRNSDVLKVYAGAFNSFIVAQPRK